MSFLQSRVMPTSLMVQITVALLLCLLATGACGDSDEDDSDPGGNNGLVDVSGGTDTSLDDSGGSSGVGDVNFGLDGGGSDPDGSSADALDDADAPNIADADDLNSTGEDGGEADAAGDTPDGDNADAGDGSDEGDATPSDADSADIEVDLNVSSEIQVTVRFDGTIGDDWRLGFELFTFDEADEFTRVREFQSEPFTTSPLVTTVLPPAEEEITVTPDENPAGLLVVYLYEDVNQNLSHDADEIVVGFSARGLAYLPGADVPTVAGDGWTLFSLLDGTPTDVSGGLDLVDYSALQDISFSTTFDPNTPAFDGISTFNINEIGQSSAVEGMTRSIDTQMDVFPETVMFTLSEPVTDEARFFDFEAPLAARLSVDYVMTYRDVDGSDDFNGGDSPIGFLCRGDDGVQFWYVPLQSRLEVVRLLAAFGLTTGWNMLIAQGEETPPLIVDDEAIPFVLRNRECMAYPE